MAWECHSRLSTTREAFSREEMAINRTQKAAAAGLLGGLCKERVTRATSRPTEQRGLQVEGKGDGKVQNSDALED